ncbi:MAG: hypothetical protein ACR2OJ_02195 [Hyphomicrobiales bacterium]
MENKRKNWVFDRKNQERFGAGDLVHIIALVIALDAGIFVLPRQ